MTCGSSGERKQEAELDDVWGSVWWTAYSAGWNGRTMETVDREVKRPGPAAVGSRAGQGRAGQSARRSQEHGWESGGSTAREVRMEDGRHEGNSGTKSGKAAQEGSAQYFATCPAEGTGQGSRQHKKTPTAWLLPMCSKMMVATQATKTGRDSSMGFSSSEERSRVASVGGRRKSAQASAKVAAKSVEGVGSVCQCGQCSVQLARDKASVDEWWEKCTTPHASAWASRCQ
ncbi:hypothetical protein B0H63DRAFT_511408 [Podospora didyma]|uniref:Uncharacterized protein n=1 Tax=Podospora didyma TaxID=330526 RepID=A0AAE0TVZ8_9PEZI|nr:hypothetical protein B0H63DRAFT_511408 [Podospora didyma]